MYRMDQDPLPLQLRLLGGFELQSERHGAAIALGRKVRALLACLALAPGTVWPREKLMALLWSERSDEQARASLRQALAELRRAMGEARPLRAEQDAISLDPGALVVDVVAFKSLAKESRWEEAASLYRGPLLDAHGVRDDAFEAWIRIERDQLHDLAMSVLDRLVAAQSGEAAIVTVRRQLQFEPAREASHRKLMSLYAAAGQRGHALRQFEHCREILRRELQAVPDAETERLHRQIQDEAGPVAAKATAKTSDSSVMASGIPSIAVLLFANLSGDPEQEYFSNGITGDIITELSRWHEILVTASSTAFHFKGGDADIREIARLGVNYVVEGSVRRSGNRVRITAQLIDAQTANHIWAERYDRELADVFDLQDEIARTIVVAVTGRMAAEGAARARRKAPSSLSAYDCYLRGREYAQAYQGILGGDPFFLKAIELDPGFAWAHAFLSLSSVMRYQFDADRSHLQAAEVWGRRALAIDSADAWCQLAVGYPLIFQNRLDEAEPYMERTIALNPNDPRISSMHALWLNYTGCTEQALASMASLLRRDPLPLDWFWDVLAIAQTTAGLYAEAIASYNRMSEIPEWGYAYLTICYIGLGQMGEARVAAAKFAAHGPISNISDFIAMEPFRDPAVLDRFAAALARGGVPQGRP